MTIFALGLKLNLNLTLSPRDPHWKPCESIDKSQVAFINIILIIELFSTLIIIFYSAVKLSLTALLTVPLADLGGGLPGARPPLRDQILSFWHTFLPKSTHVGSPRYPPTGNPGSATVYTECT